MSTVTETLAFAPTVPGSGASGGLASEFYRGEMFAMAKASWNTR